MAQARFQTHATTLRTSSTRFGHCTTLTNSPAPDLAPTGLHDTGCTMRAIPVFRGVPEALGCSLGSHSQF
ncbi:hypothetical protein VTO73DRAFT_11228 [Trametes versicolor]